MKEIATSEHTTKEIAKPDPLVRSSTIAAWLFGTLTTAVALLSIYVSNPQSFVAFWRAAWAWSLGYTLAVPVWWLLFPVSLGCLVYRSAVRRVRKVADAEIARANEAVRLGIHAFGELQESLAKAPPAIDPGQPEREKDGLSYIEFHGARFYGPKGEPVCPKCDVQMVPGWTEYPRVIERWECRKCSNVVEWRKSRDGQFWLAVQAEWEAALRKHGKLTAGIKR
jgi:hypothetical protein